MVNQSKNVDSTLCAVCGGLCCKTLPLAWDKRLGKKTIESLKLRFEYLDHKGLITTSDDKNFIYVTINIPCIHFKNGRCMIYESSDRPYICDILPDNKEKTCPYKRLYENAT